jgi:hypothetical protein
MAGSADGAHGGGTPHSCGSEPAQFNILPDKSSVPAEMMRLDFLQYQGAPSRTFREFCDGPGTGPKGRTSSHTQLFTRKLFS